MMPLWGIFRPGDQSFETIAPACILPMSRPVSTRNKIMRIIQGEGDGQVVAPSEFILDLTCVVTGNSMRHDMDYDVHQGDLIREAIQELHVLDNTALFSVRVASMVGRTNDLSLQDIPELLHDDKILSCIGMSTKGEYLACERDNPYSLTARLGFALCEAHTHTRATSLFSFLYKKVPVLHVTPIPINSHRTPPIETLLESLSALQNQGFQHPLWSDCTELLHQLIEQDRLSVNNMQQLLIHLSLVWRRIHALMPFLHVDCKGICDVINDALSECLGIRLVGLKLVPL